MAASDRTLWRRYCKRHKPAAYGKAPVESRRAPALFTVRDGRGQRYYAFATREQLYAFLAGVPGAVEVRDGQAAK